MSDHAVALLDGPGLVDPLSQRLGCPVAPVGDGELLDVSGRLGREAELVVGLSARPWPSRQEAHAQASAELTAYTGVVSWHALPALHERLAEAVAPAAAGGAHVLVTAPDPGSETAAADLQFLGEVAEALGVRLAHDRISIAWRGTTRRPTTAEVVDRLVEVHGRLDVVECPVAPATSGDPQATAAAELQGMRYVCADVGRATHLDLLEEVVRTVLGHEGWA